MERECKHCGKPFPVLVTGQRYCSDPCRTAGKRSLEKQRREKLKKPNIKDAPESLLTERCLTCKYCERLGESRYDDYFCAYILQKKMRRGCPAGDGCDKYVKRTEAKRKTFSLYGY